MKIPAVAMKIQGRADSWPPTNVPTSIPTKEKTALENGGIETSELHISQNDIFLHGAGMEYMKLISLHCYIVDDCLFDRHSCFEEHGEVPDLVGELVAEDGDGGGETGSHALAERRTNSDAVSEAVKTVSQQHHPGCNKSKTHTGD